MLHSLRHLVAIVSHPRAHITARLLIEISQWQTRQLGLNIATHAIYSALHDSGGYETLDPTEDPRAHKAGEHRYEHLAQQCEIHSLPRSDVHTGEHVCDLILTLSAQPLDRLFLS